LKKKLMKIKLCLVISLMFGITSAQTLQERKKIIASYDPVKTEKLLTEIKDDEAQRQSRVNEYLAANLDKKQDFEKDGVYFRMIDVVDGKPLFMSTENSAAARAIRVNHLYPGASLGLSLEGEGFFVGVWDSGSALKTHTEFMVDGVSKVTTPDASGTETTYHATHVVGTVAARGANTSARGMAPKASIKSYTWDADSSEVISEVTNNAMLISNHSYGIYIFNDDGGFNVPGAWYMGCYGDAARNWDQIAYNHPYYLPVMSAGNEGTTTYTGGLAFGYDKLTGNKTSKNPLIIANADPTVHPVLGSMQSLVINNGSSQGPTDDGRIKPDIAADGTALLSTSNNGDYGSSTGTSMSSPSVSGALILLQEHYNDLHPTEFMRSSTVKALVCHTALDDAASIGPDPKFGWGLLDARESVIVLNNSVATVPTSIVEELTLDQNDEYTINVTVSNPKKLKATISWIDVPGTTKNGQLNSPTPVLVNDLDLRIIKGTEENFPWKLQLSDVTAPAIKGDNTVDNVEKVEVDNASGVYTIKVSHKGTLTNGPQNYSLIVSGFDQVNLSNDKFTKENIAVYPNPVGDILYVNSDVNHFTGYEIFDIQGRLIRKELVSNVNSFEIETSSLTKGMYMLNLISEKGSFTQKIVKK
jgi:serine protease AprX